MTLQTTAGVGLAVGLATLAGCSCGSADTSFAFPDAGNVDGALADGDTRDARFLDGPGFDGGAGGVAGAGMFINEVVISPKSDWNDSDGSGLPFDATPGGGTVDVLDQYIELFFSGADSVDLTGWTIEVHDSSPSTIAIESAVTRFSPGSSLTSFQPGHYAVIATTEGSISTDAFLVLRSPGLEIFDDVEIGGLVASRDEEQDGTGDGAPDAESNGFSRGAFDEAIARVAEAPDTDDDQVDFVRMHATPLGPNVLPTPPDDSTPPTIVQRPEGTEFRVTDPIVIVFDEAVDADSADAAVTVSAGGTDLNLGFFTFEQQDRAVVVNPVGRLPFATAITITVEGGAAGVQDRAGNALAATDTFMFTTEADAANPGPVLLNEICASPRQDWNDSRGGNEVDFDATPGDGAVNSLDEWIELLNNHPGTTDFRDYSVTIYNGPTFFGAARLTTRLRDARTRVLGAGSALASVPMGNRVIVGNPRGALLSNFYLEVRDSSGTLLDHVEVGGNSTSTDRGGDGVSNGAPASGLDGRSTDTTDEVLARDPDGTDTGNDIADFAQASATLGAPN